MTAVMVSIFLSVVAIIVTVVNVRRARRHTAWLQRRAEAHGQPSRKEDPPWLG